MSTDTAGRMAVLDSLNLAVGRARAMLFAPFEFGVWIQIGLIAFLDQLARGGGGGGGGGSNFGGMPGGGGGTGNISGEVEEFRRWFIENLFWILIVGGLIAAVVLSIGLLVTWLSSRAHMMFIDAVARGRVSFGENWRNVARPAWSLFIFRVVFGLIMAAASLIVLAAMALLAWPTIASETGFSTGVLFMSLLPFVLIAVALGVGAFIIMALLHNFVTPLMYHFDEPCLTAWGRFFSVARGNALAIAGFLGLKIVFLVALSFGTMIIGCVTLCIGFLPVVHHTIFAPYYLFERAFSLYAVQSLGPEYALVADLYGPAEYYEAPPPPPPPPA
jgi:hypothetical protein